MKKLLFLFFLSFWSGSDDEYYIEMLEIGDEEESVFAPCLYGDGLIYTSIHTNDETRIHRYGLRLVRESEDNEVVDVKTLRLGKKIGRFGAGVSDYCETTDELFFTMNNKIEDGKGIVNWSLYYGGINGNVIDKITELPFCGLSFSYTHPTISSNGTSLIFSSNMDGIYKLYLSKRNVDNGEWSEPKLIEELDDEVEKFFPKYINDSLLVFSMKEKDGLGELDIYKSENINEVWTFPENWEELNSVYNDYGVEMIDENKGYFCSDRDFKAAKIYYFEIPD